MGRLDAPSPSSLSPWDQFPVSAHCDPVALVFFHLSPSGALTSLHPEGHSPRHGHTHPPHTVCGESHSPFPRRTVRSRHKPPNGGCVVEGTVYHPRYLDGGATSSIGSPRLP